MTVMGVNFTKMHVERKESKKGKINVSNNVSISNVEKMDLKIGDENQQPLRFSFNFTSKYNPDIGNITLEGNVVYLADKKKAEEILKGWKDNNKVEEKTRDVILGNVLNKCSIESLLLSKEMNLPAPVPLPKIKKQEKKQGSKQS